MIHTFKVLSTLSAYRAVCAVTGTAFTVKYPDTSTCLPIGVTKDTVKDTTNSIPIAVAGERALLYFQDTCASGEIVGFDKTGIAGGKRWTFAGATTASAYLGVLLGPTVALTGTLAEILVQPGFGQGT